MRDPVQACPQVGLVGVSGYGAVHLELLLALHDAGRARLTDAVVINPDDEPAAMAALAARGITVHQTFDAMRAAGRGRLDLCAIPTGIPWHRRMTVAALESGMNVLVEKPLAGSMEDAQAIREAERRSGRLVMVGFQDIYSADARWLKSRLAGGAIGAIERVRWLAFWPRARSYYDRNNWAGRLAVDGVAVRDSPINNALAHYVNLALFFAGAADENEASAPTVTDAELFRANDIESFDTCVVKARAKGGTRFWFGASHACRELRHPKILIDGSEGTAFWEFGGKCGTESVKNGSETRRPSADMESRHEMYDAVVNRLTDDSVHVCGTALAAVHTSFIEQVHKRAEIQGIPQAMVEAHWLEETGGSPVMTIRGVEATLQKCFENMSMPGECGLPATGRP